MSVLVIAEHDNEVMRNTMLPIINAAKNFESEIHVLVPGYKCKSVGEQIATIDGVDKVLLADSVNYEHQLPENLSQLVVDISSEYKHIMAPATAFGKNFLPRVAALLDVEQISDVVEIISFDTFKRPIYAGNALETIQSNDNIKVLTVRTIAFSPAKISEEAAAPIEINNKVIENEQAHFIGYEFAESEHPELTSARIVVSAGRGVKSKENFKLVEDLAKQLGAAVGASRAAIDSGYATSDSQIGQTGKIIAPDLYIAVGISGAIQHMAGVRDARVVVAINNDPRAAIFEQADYILVGNLTYILPELTAELALIF